MRKGYDFCSTATGAGGGAGAQGAHLALGGKPLICPSLRPLSLYPALDLPRREQASAVFKVLKQEEGKWAVREHVENHPRD